MSDLDPREVKLIKELKDLINKCSRENESDTPDFILGDYLYRAIRNWEITTNRRETWYGRDKKEVKVKTDLS